MERNNILYITYLLTTIFFVSACNLKRNNDSNGKQLYCKRKIEVLSSSYKAQNLLLVSLDTLKSLTQLSNNIQLHYRINGESDTQRYKVGFPYNISNDYITFEGGGQHVFLCEFYNICRVNDLKINPEPMRSVIYGHIYVDRVGSFIDFDFNDRKDEDEYLRIKFSENTDIQMHKAYQLSMENELDPLTFQLALQRIMHNYILAINDYAEEKYLSNICSLEETIYAKLIYHNKLHLEVNLLPISESSYIFFDINKD